jgi:outer membrane receptor for ferrienterochelin and colicins
MPPTSAFLPVCRCLRCRCAGAPSRRRAVAQATALALGWATLSTLAQPSPPAPVGTGPAPAPVAPGAAAEVSPPPAPTAPASPPAAAPASPPAAASGQRLLPRVQIQGGRPGDIEERRQSTAAKIVIGREEIDRFGDSTLGEVLRRLPGVSVPGPAGRGGGPRLRGLGGGYTQLLIDGQRAPQGFSLEDIAPDQVERIEILRAPTAETGARAIGGTINIVTREGFRVRLNDLRAGFETQRGRTSPGLSWTWNQPFDDLIANLSASVFQRRQIYSSTTTITDDDAATGARLREQVQTSHNEELRNGLNLTSRLQWRRESGNLLVLSPTLFHIQGTNERTFSLSQPVGTEPATYALAFADQHNRFTNARLNGQWRQRLGDGLRAELNGGGGAWTARFGTVRDESDAAGGFLRRLDDSGRVDERSLNLTGKLSKLIDGNHSVTAGTEVEGARRTESRRTLENGLPIASEFGNDLSASSLRLAVYAQNEWEINPAWSAYAGLRWEGIDTRGTGVDGTRPENRSSVTTPLLHALWKPVPGGRDQVRMSLTRSYRSPTLQNLVARPNVSNRFPVGGSNDPTSPDRAGNPGLKPELATGVDMALERYLPEGGVLSASMFHRRLTDTIRDVTSLETVTWSPAARWVTRPQNVGGATTQGIELEARFRLDQLVAGGPRTEMRTNLSLYRSRVDRVPGPDNRLASQPPGTLNLGADHRFRGTPLTMGGTLGWTPSYETRLSAAETTGTPLRRQWDAYALWRFGPAAQVRLTATNLLPREDSSFEAVETATLRQVSRTVQDTSTRWGLRLEFKL